MKKAIKYTLSLGAIGLIAASNVCAENTEKTSVNPIKTKSSTSKQANTLEQTISVDQIKAVKYNNGYKFCMTITVKGKSRDKIKAVGIKEEYIFIDNKPVKTKNADIYNILFDINVGRYGYEPGNILFFSEKLKTHDKPAKGKYIAQDQSIGDKNGNARVVWDNFNRWLFYDFKNPLGVPRISRYHSVEDTACSLTSDSLPKLYLIKFNDKKNNKHVYLPLTEKEAGQLKKHKSLFVEGICLEGYIKELGKVHTEILSLRKRDAENKLKKDYIDLIKGE